ncbi:MAG: hypothetical protein C0613_12300 [Desulfobulbaceae bacterium]|nr:MAG: hypothetical protein C0613_12300 [Desulfobulbaceae bacterium]
MAGEAAWQLVRQADQLFIADGKKIRILRPTSDNKEEIMQKMLGRTGNLRAPTLRRGNTFYIGYNDELYQEVTGS